MTGDLNDLQQLALLTYLQQQDSKQADADWQNLRMRLLVHGIRPEQIPEILEALEGEREKDGIEEHAPALSDEEMEDYIPLSVEETSQAIEQLRRFGLAYQDIAT